MGYCCYHGSWISPAYRVLSNFSLFCENTFPLSESFVISTIQLHCVILTYIYGNRYPYLLLNYWDYFIYFTLFYFNFPISLASLHSHFLFHYHQSFHCHSLIPGFTDGSPLFTHFNAPPIFSFLEPRINFLSFRWHHRILHTTITLWCLPTIVILYPNITIHGHGGTGQSVWATSRWVQRCQCSESRRARKQIAGSKQWMIGNQSRISTCDLSLYLSIYLSNLISSITWSITWRSPGLPITCSPPTNMQRPRCTQNLSWALRIMDGTIPKFSRHGWAQKGADHDASQVGCCETVEYDEEVDELGMNGYDDMKRIFVDV